MTRTLFSALFATLRAAGGRPIAFVASREVVNLFLESTYYVMANNCQKRKKIFVRGCAEHAGEPNEFSASSQRVLSQCWYCFYTKDVERFAKACDNNDNNNNNNNDNNLLRRRFD
jgi:hypothetical protein